MKSATRAWIMMVLLFFLWQTIAASPFRYFADLFGEVVGFVVTRPLLAKPVQALIIYLLFGLLLTGLLLVGRYRNRVFIGGLCALTTLVGQLAAAVRTGRLDSVSVAVAIGLALALLFLIIRASSPALWLSDAYVLALAVWLIYDGVLPPLLRILRPGSGAISGFFSLPGNEWIWSLSGFLGLPVIVWAFLPLCAAVLPVAFCASGRQKG